MYMCTYVRTWIGTLYVANIYRANPIGTRDGQTCQPTKNLDTPTIALILQLAVRPSVHCTVTHNRNPCVPRVTYPRPGFPGGGYSSRSATRRPGDRI